MDLALVVEEILLAIGQAGWLEQMDLQLAGRIAHGRVHLGEDLFVRFFFNAETGTRSFALISQQKRVWGVDFDNRRGWHRHPLGSTTQHLLISPVSVTEIIQELTEVVNTFL